ncbi:hypothetical protein HDU97_003013 [Phlyctochytrium planicorne]|nr:hypothetical protein HDU97_003013 [Phlyctochytrium planicorne]
MFSILIVILQLLATFSLVARADSVQATVKGVTFVNNINDGLIARELAHMIRANCLAQIDSDITVTLNAAVPNQGSIQLTANVHSSNNACMANIDMIVTPQTRLRAQIKAASKGDAEKDVAAHTLSALLQQGNGRFPRQLTAEITGVKVAMTIDSKVDAGAACPFGVNGGPKNLQGENFDFVLNC